MTRDAQHEGSARQLGSLARAGDVQQGAARDGAGDGHVRGDLRRPQRGTAGLDRG